MKGYLSTILSNKEFWLAATGIIPLISSNYGLLLQIVKSLKLKQMSHLAWSLVITMVITTVSCLVHDALIGALWLGLKDLLAFGCAITLLIMKIIFERRASRDSN